MNNNHHIIDIKILDRTYKIKCTPQEKNELLLSAQYLDKKMKSTSQLTPSTQTDRIAIVTALNICHELLQLKQQQSPQTTNQRFYDLYKRIKNSLATEEEIAV